MKKLIISALILLAAASCKKHDDDYVNDHFATMALLKVDYQTHQFEGGKVFQLAKYQGQDIPVQINYKAPGDFGNITLLYAPTGDSLFDGSIIWSGKGEMRFPALSNNFSSVTTAQPAPDSNHVQIISPNMFFAQEHYDLPGAWNGISKLLVTKQFLQQANVRIGLFLYTPSVGVGDPADWDYFWVLYIGDPAI